MTRTKNKRSFGYNSMPHAAACDIVPQLHDAIDGYATSIVPLLGASYGPDCIQQAWREFTLDDGSLFTVDDAHCEIFFSWLFHCWSPAPEKGNQLADPGLYGVPPTRAYLARKSRRLKPLLRRYLEACLATSLSFYEIVKCHRNIGFRVQDVFIGMEVEVIESLASTSLSDGDIIFARIPRVDGISVLDAISPVSFPQPLRTWISNRHRCLESCKNPDLALRRMYFELLPLIAAGAACLHRL